MLYEHFHGEVQGGNGKRVDQVLREYFTDFNYKGVFFDVGAFEPIRISNSYHFERNGWTCYCFEANTNGIPLLKKHRANVFNYAISNTNKDFVEFSVVNWNGWTAGFSSININEDYKKIFGSPPPETITKIRVPQKTLNSVIENEIPGLSRIDIMSLDIEGGEFDCLQGFDLEKYKPRVMVVENVDPNNNKVDDYLRRFGYRLDKQISYNYYYLANDFK